MNGTGAAQTEPATFGSIQGSARADHGWGWSGLCGGCSSSGGNPLCFPSLAHPLAIAATLLTTALAATFRLPPGPARSPPPPPPRRPLTLRTAIPRLRPLRLEELLAPLQQTATLPRLLSGTPYTRCLILRPPSAPDQSSPHPAATSPPVGRRRLPPATRPPGRRNGPIAGRR